MKTAQLIFIEQALDETDKLSRLVIMGVSWKDHMTNKELFSSAGIGDLQDIVADRRRRFIGHVSTPQHQDQPVW